MIASIPSPSFDSIDIGPFSLNMYGLMIALGVVAAIWMMGRRFEQRGVGSTDDASAIGLWAVLAGIIGSRLYHVATDWERFEDDLGSIPKIWEGGLGIPGGLLFGIPVGLYVAHRRGIGPGVTATCAAPAIPLAQAIGRWGNWFNQELYGEPTDVPWALEIDPEHRVDGYESFETFHPTFLYESLWNFGLVGLLLWIDRRFTLRNGSLMAIYVIGYGVGRFWIEGLRIDDADVIAGLRWNQWVALAAVVGGAVVLWLLERRPAPAGDGAGEGAGEAVPLGSDGPDGDVGDGEVDDGEVVDGEVVDGDADDDEVGDGEVDDGEVDDSVGRHEPDSRDPDEISSEEAG